MDLFSFIFGGYGAKLVYDYLGVRVYVEWWNPFTKFVYSRCWVIRWFKQSSS